MTDDAVDDGGGAGVEQSEPLITWSTENALAGGDADESSLSSPGLFLWTLTLCACFATILFGYDTGVISSMLVLIDSDLSSRRLTTLDKSVITSCTSLFALLASPLTGLLADQFGRKRVLIGADVLFIVGAIWQATTTSVAGMVGGRSVVGIAIGSASFVVPLYISELSPSPFRGRLVVVSTLFITVGQVVAYLVGWAFSATPAGWRIIVGLGIVPAALQLAMLVAMPETPRWLLRAGQTEHARKVLARVYGGDAAAMKPLVNAVLRRVEQEIHEEDDAADQRAVPGTGKPGIKANVARIRDRFAQLVLVAGNRRALVIACFLQGFQQLSGFNSLMYFSATIFSLVGFRSPTLTSLSIAITNFIFTLVAFYYVDRVGRRRILLLSIPIMVLGLALCAIAFNFLKLPADGATTGAAGQRSADGPGVWPLAILLAMVVYVAGYGIGIGNVPWQQSELFPLSVRSLGSGLATATNWGSNFLIGISFLPFMQFLTPVGTFSLYAFICAGAWVIAWKIYPETAGLGLEDVGDLLSDGWGVEESVKRAQGRRAVRDGNTDA